MTEEVKDRIDAALAEQEPDRNSGEPAEILLESKDPDGTIRVTRLPLEHSKENQRD